MLSDCKSHWSKDPVYTEDIFKEKFRKNETAAAAATATITIITIPTTTTIIFAFCFMVIC